jgi:hypothetical protein
MSGVMRFLRCRVSLTAGSILGILAVVLIVSAAWPRMPDWAGCVVGAIFGAAESWWAPRKPRGGAR